MRQFGEYLKAQREERGVSLEEIAQETKIRMAFLEAMEKGEFNKLPGEFYCRAYLRSYAKTIGIREEELLEKYELALAEAEKKGEQEALPIEKKWDGTLQQTVASKSELPNGKRKAIIVIVVLLTFLIALGAYLIWGSDFTTLNEDLGVADQEKDRVTNTVEDQSADTDTDTDPLAKDGSISSSQGDLVDRDLDDLDKEGLSEDLASQTSQSSQASVDSEIITPQKKESELSSLSLIIKASDECWYAVSDSKKVLREGVLRAGDEISINSTETLKVQLGKPQVVTVFANGTLIDLKNNPRELTISQDGEVNIIKLW